MLTDDIYHAELLVHHNGQLSRHPAGRVLVRGGNAHILEDYHGALGNVVPEGPIDDLTVHKLNNPGPHLSIASHHDIAHGHRLDFVPDHPLPNMLPDPVDTTPAAMKQHVEVKPPSIFHYTRAGHDQPHVLEVKEGKHLLDGNPLKDDEVAAILDNVRMKAAKLRYVKSQAAPAVAKMEQFFVNLRKADEMDPMEAFKHLHAAAEAGHVPRAALDALRRQIYTDPMAPGLGNKYAFNEFNAKKKPGVYISMDGNDFKAINDLHGHAAGDTAIKSFGQAAREAMDEAVGSDKAKLFRNPDQQNLYRSGGDEFVAHVPTHEHAAAFARALRNKLDQFQPINGQHKLSMSFGFGHDYDSADKALGHAKEQKYAGPATSPGMPRARRFSVGQVPSLAHSLVPGHEGAVPLDENVAHVAPPKLPPEPKPVSPPASAAPTP